jgi:hypothetical protein
MEPLTRTCHTPAGENHTWLLLLSVLALIFCNALRASADSGSFEPGTPTSHTPYDAYLSPMWAVFEKLGGDQPDPVIVESLLRQDHAFRYSFDSANPYQPQSPEQTDKTQAGDCKAKSLWLAYKMGTRSVVYVIGKARAESTMSHAWLVWNGPRGWQILDATNYSDPLSIHHMSASEFIPLYCYSTSGKYVHSVASAQGSAKYADHL